ARAVRQRGGHRGLDAELVRPVRLALADAFYLRRMQRVDFGSALVLLLLEHPSRSRQHALQHQPTEHIGIATEFAADVADDAAQTGLELPQGFVGALELLG